MTNTTDTSREEFESWLKTKPDARFWNTTDAMFAAWVAARAQPINGSIDSQLDSNTLKKMAFLSESKSMRPVGVVMIDDATGQRATVDMGRVTWTGQNVERVALSDAEIFEISGEFACDAVGKGNLIRIARAILAAQADPITPNSTELEPHPPSRHCMCKECKPSFESDCLGVPLTQPLIAEAARDDVATGLTDKQIEVGWHKTFSTSNPYCPCNLKSFTKAVRWTLAAIAAGKKDAQ